MRCAADGIALDHVDLGGGLGIRYRDEHAGRASPATRRWCAGLFAGRARAAAVRARPPARRRRGRAADARTCRQAGRVAQFRRRRRRDERPAAPGALRRVARQSIRCARAQATLRGTGTSSGRSARAATSWRSTASSRSPRTTCSPSATAGAYAMAMSSNYNARPRACEVLVDGASVHLDSPPRDDRRTSRARNSLADASATLKRSRKSRAMRVGIRVCEFATVRYPTRSNRRLKSCKRSNVATMQAAGANGFVKGSARICWK